MKKIILLMSLFTMMSCKSQAINKLTFDNIKPPLVDFLYSKKQIDSERAKKIKNGEYKFNLRGVVNNLSDGLMQNGMYAFSSFGSHCKAYFVIVENDKYIILDIDTREGLEEAIKNILDYSERNKYCVDVTKDYISRIISVYYNINVNPTAGHDLNCEKGFDNFKSLP